jgi:hypothetical protein
MTSIKSLTLSGGVELALSCLPVFLFLLFLPPEPRGQYLLLFYRGSGRWCGEIGAFGTQEQAYTKEKNMFIACRVGFCHITRLGIPKA